MSETAFIHIRTEHMAAHRHTSRPRQDHSNGFPLWLQIHSRPQPTSQFPSRSMCEVAEELLRPTFYLRNDSAESPTFSQAKCSTHASPIQVARPKGLFSLGGICQFAEEFGPTFDVRNYSAESPMFCRAKCPIHTSPIQATLQDRHLRIR